MDESLDGCAALMDELQRVQNRHASLPILIGGELAGRHSDQLTALGMHPTHEWQMTRRLSELLKR